MSWQSTLSWKNAQKKAFILQQIRQFFKERNVIEVETPALAKGTVTDVHLEGFNCNYKYLTKNSSELYLQTSPEFHMKRLLASGYGCIFQISKAFRYEEAGRYHNPEFSLLEWYRLDFDHFQLIKEVSDLLKIILKCSEPRVITYQNIFLEYVDLDPLTATRGELITLIENNNKCSDWLFKEEDNDILLQFIFSEIIEPVIGINEPYFVYNFPKSQASLAKLCPKDNRVAQRFECYFQGVELVNGFNELTEHDKQLSRFHKDNIKRKKLNLESKPIDSYFLSALHHGLPACSGVALGIDRLLMLALKVESINQVISFPIERA